MLDESIFAGVPLAVVGSVCRDVKTAPIAPGPHLLRDGETPAAFLVETLGGGGANTAAMAAGLGARVAFAGKVGADALGDRLVGALERAGVRVLARRDPAVATGSSIALTYSDGQRHFISHQPNNATLDFVDVDPTTWANGGHLLRADVWFSEPMLTGGNARLFASARSAGIATSLDINWDPQWGFADAAAIATRMAAVRGVLPLVDLVHGNVRELNRFAGTDDLSETLRRLTVWGTGAVVVHMGDAGSGYYSAGELVVAPCVPAERMLNTAGTGDLLSLCMMLLHHRTESPAVEKLRLANRVVTSFIEGRPLLPTL
ncbi:carbohydrate kinase family protein [Fimbriiglobus ruber]|uniref:Ribokinase n=1 Tax=Fimbriiglobus ruber TaxID=1908690 RepID=A0A225D2Y4_9BACT|nr:carbohydrate kinase family protein [Fimbriiglobus ruber]OWK35951.1 Ribokinase [Fimbriiglobus ruber]